MEADFSFGNPALVPDLRRGIFFRSVTLSPYYSLAMLESVSRLYRVNHWLWSPVDLLDKRFYVPTVKNLRFFSFCSNDFAVYADSLFYKTKIVFNKDAKLSRENLFFFDSVRYDNNSFSFLSYQVAPSINAVDFFSLKTKPRLYTCKPFFMSFKNFSQNQIESFEKFYLKDKLFLADSFDII